MDKKEFSRKWFLGLLFLFGGLCFIGVLMVELKTTLGLFNKYGVSGRTIFAALSGGLLDILLNPGFWLGGISLFLAFRKLRSKK